MSILEQVNSPIGKLRIYACGGAGTNIGRAFYNQSTMPGASDTSVCFLDTSRSNVSSDIRESDIYLIEGADGSGKIRKENYTSIVNVIKQIPGTFVPGDLNLVVFSASGGSGSVWGPLLVAELQSRNVPVIAVVIGSHESLIAINNTLKTLESLDNIARNTKRAIVALAFDNGNNSKRGEVDTEAKTAITKLSVLASRLHRELDTSDIKTWLRYETNSGVAPQLAMLCIAHDTTSLATATRNDYISIASLVLEGVTSDIGSLGADYQVTGYMDATSPLAETRECHFAIDVDSTSDLVEMYVKQAETMRNKANNRIRHSGVGDSSGDENHMVL